MKSYILCAGVGYEFLGEPFAKFAATRLKFILDTAPKEDLLIQTFDVRAGSVATTTVKWESGKRTITTKTDKSFEEVTKLHYDRPPQGTHQWRFKDNHPKVMSITDIYAAIKTLGETAPGTLMEVSFFSHAFYEGPILVNSSDDGYVLSPHGQPIESMRIESGVRDPDDKDGRAGKDFTSPAMSSSFRDAFRKAFNPKGFVWVWGCSFPPVVNVFLRMVEKNPKYSSSIADDAILEFSNLKQHQIDSVRALQGYLNIDIDDLKRKRKFKVPFKAAKEAVWAGVAGSYAFALATKLKIRAIAALYGTYSDFNAGSPPLMAISPDTAVHVAFHKKHFRFKTDHEGRNYGVFDPAILVEEA